ncbi:four helix bundle protein [Roseivirga sp. E12]|uniref:four helix bundle protein n=1 Tax=Roseivirga sp. E12 TaxID=2819237 RepID=UPI001ABC5F8C|nr:four helix bundle protein [Roseivirga sp. E12]MBO3698750.1 four helix bundle protein [Roseivirga sp. E12]
MHNYKELKVWKRAIDFAQLIYQTTKDFPAEEKFGLISQLRRAAVSVPSNIAEGAGRNTKGEFGQFLGIASGSLCEIETQTIIAKNLELIGKEAFESISEEIDHLQRMLFNLKKSLR